MKGGLPGGAAQVLDIMNMAFTAVFTVELITNFVAHRFSEFISNSWCAAPRWGAEHRPVATGTDRTCGGRSWAMGGGWARGPRGRLEA